MIDAVKIGNAVYTVKEDNDQYLIGCNCLGEIDYGRQEILIKSDLPKERKELVLAHELTHGIVYESGMDWFSDELKIRQLSPYVLSLIKENKFNFGNSCR